MRCFSISAWLSLMLLGGSFPVVAEPVPPVRLANDTVEWIPGSLPLIIAAPHGGQLEPAGIPDRKDGVTTRDAETDLLAVDLAAAVERQYGERPHLILCHLHRKKVDCNRDALTGTGGHPKALATWRAFHEAIGRARAAAGRGLFLDLHGHSHPAPKVEIGYLLGAEQLRETGPAFAALAQVSSLASVAKTSPDTFEGLLRGPRSLGALLEEAGYPSVPSPTSPDPGEDPYFRGGYNTARYRTGGGEDRFFAIQIECPRPGVRDSIENRRRFAEALAAALGVWLSHHAGVDLKAAGAGPLPKGGSE